MQLLLLSVCDFFCDYLRPPPPREPPPPPPREPPPENPEPRDWLPTDERLLLLLLLLPLLVLRVTDERFSDDVRLLTDERSLFLLSLFTLSRC